jgi:hypothetical protein
MTVLLNNSSTPGRKPFFRNNKGNKAMLEMANINIVLLKGLTALEASFFLDRKYPVTIKKKGTAHLPDSRIAAPISSEPSPE